MLEFRGQGEMIACAAGLVIRHKEFLAEVRSPTKALAPATIAIPGGHMENSETPEKTLLRELMEELEIVPLECKFICSLLHRSQEFRLIHYFAVETWTGKMASNEAASLLWLPLNDTSRLDFDVDKTAVREYLRIYRALLPNTAFSID